MAEAFIGGHRVISTGEQAVAGYVWDTTTLSWIASTASAGGGASGNVNVTNTSLPVSQVGTWTVVTGGLTDTQLRASAVPVSIAGTQNVNGSVSVSNFPATQAISASALPLPAGAATETTLAAVNTKTPTLGQALMAASSPVVIASNQSALPVTGTFFQGTQPVSIASMPTTPVTGSFWQATQPVSGTFWQATQPVSIASMPSTPVTGTFWQTTQPVSLASTTITGSVAVTGSFFQATQPVSIAALPALATGANVIGGVTQSGTWNVGSITTLPALPAGTNTIGAVNIAAAQTIAVTQATAANLNATVTPIAITKATQGATGFTTQDLKDAGRSARTITLDSFAVAATTETLNTMSYSTDNGTLTTGTSYTVTTAKRLRIQQIAMSLHTIASNTTPAAVMVRVRVNNAGAAIVTSPVEVIVAIPGIAAANNSTAPVVIPFPDGWEFIAGAGIGVTTTCPGFVASTAAPKVNITITGFEY